MLCNRHPDFHRIVLWCEICFPRSVIKVNRAKTSCPSSGLDCIKLNAVDCWLGLSENVKMKILKLVTFFLLYNWIFMWVCFLAFLDLRPSSLVNRPFSVGPYLQGKKGQNKPENPQNWNMAKIAPKSDKFTK